jgi:formylglycine-generating enzyme required for sulfatase activity/serine/threonine protein kinase
MPTPPSSDPEAKKDTPSTGFETQPGSGLPTTGVPSGASGDGALSLRQGARPLPDYELVRKLGQGGFGEVWHARGPGGMDVALKFIKLSGKGGDAEMRALETMKSIRHANLVSLFGVWRKDDSLILAMELCDRTLRDRLREALAQKLPGIPLAELLNYMRDAANGLDALNARQVQHRDVKPLNLFLLAGSVKVADFGLAKLLEHTVASHTGAMTLAYAAPEFMKGQVSQHSDQYCLAVTYCELRTGRLPFGGNFHEMMFGHMHQPPDLSRLDTEEREVVARALSKEPGQRWPSCRAFVDALILATQGGNSKVTVQARRKAELPAGIAVSTTGRWLWAGLAGALCVGILGLCVACGAPFSGLFSNTKPTNSTGDTTRVADPTSHDDGQSSQRADKDSATTKDGKEKDKDKQPEPKSSTLPATMTIDLGDGVKMEFVLIDPKSKPDGGVFQLGDVKGDDEDKPHQVRMVKSYYLGKYVVTQQQYKQVTGDNPSWFRAGGGGADLVRDLNTNLLPVEEISWVMADAFCKELTKNHSDQLPAELRQKGYRFALPTEAQWEYACRAGTTTSFFFGDDPKDLGDHAWFTNNSGGRPHSATEKDTSNPWGLYDMHGNVWQWCQDYYGPYQGLAQEDPLRSVRYSEDRRVLRGGSWFIDASVCRAAFRFRCGPSAALSDWGFRVSVRLD